MGVFVEFIFMYSKITKTKILPYIQFYNLSSPRAMLYNIFELVSIFLLRFVRYHSAFLYVIIYLTSPVTGDPEDHSSPRVTNVGTSAEINGLRRWAGEAAQQETCLSWLPEDLCVAPQRPPNGHAHLQPQCRETVHPWGSLPAETKFSGIACLNNK